jgi:hypothetical protein
MAEKPKDEVEMAPDPEEDDLDDLDGKHSHQAIRQIALYLRVYRRTRPIRLQTQTRTPSLLRPR